VGLKTRQLPPQTCTAIEFRLKAQDENPNHLTFWQGHDSLNLGYIWVFPKVKSGVVNLGAGVLTPKLGAKNMYDLTEEWRQKLYPGAELEKVHGGAVPVSGNLAEFASDRFLLSGDAAHHTNPLTGGGIMASIVAADTASKWIDLGFKAGRLDREYLRRYEEECWDRFGRNHHKESRIRDFVLGLPRDAQAKFFGAFKTMVDGNFNIPSRVAGFSRMGWLAATHPTLTRKAFFG
jgi:digeranylgeranylglycerophospholipid reductase